MKTMTQVLHKNQSRFKIKTEPLSTPNRNSTQPINQDIETIELAPIERNVSSSSQELNSIQENRLLWQEIEALKLEIDELKSKNQFC